MTSEQSMISPLDEGVDHVRGAKGARLIGRHFPLTEIHPRALAASRAAEAAALQARFWEMHEMLFHRQKAPEDGDLRRYASELGLDVGRFGNDRSSEVVLERIERDFRSGIESGQVRGTPTLFIDGVVHLGCFDAETLLVLVKR
jgi:protein-disulfide isomerase